MVWASPQTKITSLSPSPMGMLKQKLQVLTVQRLGGFVRKKKMFHV